MANIYHELLKPLHRAYIELYPDADPKIRQTDFDPEAASEAIYNMLVSGRSCMIARFGSAELYMITNYMSIQSSNHNPIDYIKNKIPPFWWYGRLMNEMMYCAGFFPLEKEYLSRFCELQLEDSRLIDILGSWLYAEKELNGYFSPTMIKTFLEYLQPWYGTNPWTRVLEGKRVVVVHPFKDDIEHQYHNYREKLFADKRLLPQFDLRVVPAVQSVGGSTDFKDWFEALDRMKAEIDSADYDIALIGCGAYGMSLAAHCKRQGKQAVHLGGVLQLLFGIWGERWNRGYNPYFEYEDLKNEYWIRPTFRKIKYGNDGKYW